MRSEVRPLSGAFLKPHGAHLKVLSTSLGPFATNAYLVIDEKNGLAIAIDAPLGSVAWYEEQCKKHSVILKALLLTHSHLDHVADCAEIHTKMGAPIYLHALDKDNLERPGSDGLPLVFSYPKAAVDVFVKEGDLLSFGNLFFIVIETPGHTPGGVCYFMKESGVLFSGDTLFARSIGNLSFPTARVESMWISLKKLALLPQETLVYPGHGRSTQIGKESWLNNAEEFFG